MKVWGWGWGWVAGWASSWDWLCLENVGQFKPLPIDWDQSAVVQGPPLVTPPTPAPTCVMMPEML